MYILLAWYMVDVKVFEPHGHVNSYVVIGYQVSMSDFILPVNLVNDEFRVTVCSKIFNANLIGDLHSNQESIVFCYIVGAWLG